MTKKAYEEKSEEIVLLTREADKHDEAWTFENNKINKDNNDKQQPPIVVEEEEEQIAAAAATTAAEQRPF